MSLPTANPSQVRIDAQGVLDLLDAAAHLQLHSLAIARDGQAAVRGWWAPYAAERRHLLYSCSKSVTATTVGALVGEGVLSLDDLVLDRLPADAVAGAGEIADVWRRLTIRHCLSMTVGHTYDAWPRSAALAAEPLHTILATPPDAEPGSVFAYNQVGPYLVSRAVENVTGSTLDEVALDRVLSPLGIEEIEWERDNAGHPLGFTGARLRTDDLLALAQLWLDGGAWGGQQVVPAEWVVEASRPFLPVESDSTSDWEHGYGYSFWIARHGYRADGAFGQYGIVLPEQRVAVAITSELADMQPLLDLIWTHLLPAIDRPGSEDADARLAKRLAALSFDPLASTVPAQGEPRSWPVDPASDLDPAYTGVSVDETGTTLTLTRAGTEIPIAVGDGSWAESEMVADGRHLPVVASGGWTDEGLTAQVRLIETPHSFEVTAGAAGALLHWRMAPLRSADPMDCAVR